jgi:nucleotide-binding universal stress UspA family protein
MNSVGKLMVVPMFKHLLIATDGSELSQKAITHAIALAKPLEAKITVVHVTLPWTAMSVGENSISLPPEKYEKTSSNTAKRILDEVAEIAKNEGVPCATLHVEGRSPAEKIIHTANEVQADLIVMSSHGRSGLARLLLGSEAGDVVSRSQIPVLICR